MPSNLSTGVQYSVKNMFDRQTGFPGSTFKNPRESSQLLATSLLANTGASGGSLSRIARSSSVANANNLVLLAYRR